MFITINANYFLNMSKVIAIYMAPTILYITNMTCVYFKVEIFKTEAHLNYFHVMYTYKTLVISGKLCCCVKKPEYIKTF